MKDFTEAIKNILNIQYYAWTKGHDNSGTEIDAKACIKKYLLKFDHLNFKQQKLLDELNLCSELKYSKPLCSKANKIARYYVVTLK